MDSGPPPKLVLWQAVGTKGSAIGAEMRGSRTGGSLAILTLVCLSCCCIQHHPWGPSAAGDWHPTATSFPPTVGMALTHTSLLFWLLLGTALGWNKGGTKCCQQKISLLRMVAITPPQEFHIHFPHLCCPTLPLPHVFTHRRDATGTIQSLFSFRAVWCVAPFIAGSLAPPPPPARTCVQSGCTLRHGLGYFVGVGASPPELPPPPSPTTPQQPFQAAEGSGNFLGCFRAFGPFCRCLLAEKQLFCALGTGRFGYFSPFINVKGVVPHQA